MYFFVSDVIPNFAEAVSVPTLMAGNLQRPTRDCKWQVECVCVCGLVPTLAVERKSGTFSLNS